MKGTTLEDKAISGRIFSFNRSYSLCTLLLVSKKSSEIPLKDWNPPETANGELGPNIDSI